MAKRSQSSIELSNNITVLLEFLAAPLEFYPARQNELTYLFIRVDSTATGSPLKGEIENYPARQSLKDLFDETSLVAAAFLEKKDGIGIRSLNTYLTKLNVQKIKLDKFRSANLIDGEIDHDDKRDNPDIGIKQKHLIGAETIDGAFITALSSAINLSRQIANQHSPKKG